MRKKISTKGLVLHNRAMRKYTPGFRAFYQMTVSNAAQRGIEMKLSVAQIFKLAKAPCNYCGIPPQPRTFGSMAYIEAVSGLDRIDSKKGYTPKNTVPACKICNRVKLTATPAEYLEHAKRVVRHNKAGV